MLDLGTTVVPVSAMAHLYELIFLLGESAIKGQVYQEGKWEKVDCFDQWCEACYKEKYLGDDVTTFMQKISSETIAKALESDDKYTVEFSVATEKTEHRKCLSAFSCEDESICVCVNDVTTEYKKEQSLERIAGDCIEMTQQTLLEMEGLWGSINEETRLPAAQAVEMLEVGLKKEHEESQIYVKEAIHVLKKYTDTLEGIFLLSQLQKGMEIKNEDIIFVSDFLTDLVRMTQLQTESEVRDIEVKESLKAMSGFVSNRLYIKQIAVGALSIMISNSREHSVRATLDFEKEKEELCFCIQAEETETMFIRDSRMECVRRLVGYMQGELYFETEEERTTLLITIPVKAADKEKMRNAKAMERMLDSIENKDFSSFRALVIDDDIICREIVVSKLKRFGLDVEIATDGQEAMEKLLASPARYYHIIFTKMMLPKKSGLAMTKELRKLSRNDLNDITIVAISMNRETDRRLTALEYGMDYHLVLPIDDVEMNHILLRELKNIGPEEAYEKFGFRIIK